MSREYTLDSNNRPVLAEFGEAWKWAQENPYRKVVGFTQFPMGGRVSTVFLVLDHGWDEGDPTLWETMVFDTPPGSVYEDGWQDRYKSYESAVEGHITVVKALLGIEQ